MNEHIDQLNQAKNILSGILGTALNSLNDNKHVVQDAKNHIRQAITKLESVSKKQIRKQKGQTNHEKWWGNITANVANVSMSKETAQAVMGKLNNMIGEEQQKIKDLEKQSLEFNDENLLVD